MYASYFINGQVFNNNQLNFTALSLCGIISIEKKREGHVYGEENLIKMISVGIVATL